MGSNALWLSKDEQVEVETILNGERTNAYQEPKFQAKRQDGSRIVVDRRDILLEEEAAFVDELARILRQKQLKSKNGRYAEIMRYLLKQGAPFAGRLQHLVSDKHQLDIFDDVG